MEDAPLMLEWMHDENVVNNLLTDFPQKTLLDCEDFIVSSLKESQDLHLAIVDDNNEYMGTVSLKHINKEKHSAEFAIAIRSCAMGKGVSQFGMQEILKIGVQKLALQRIYWCVSKENKRAIRFYAKNGYQYVDSAELEHLVEGYNHEQIMSYIWYLYKPRSG